MFRTANATARQFTRPIVLSRLPVNGKAESLIGTFIVLNDEGWILTAAHIVVALEKMRADKAAYHNRPSEKAAIEADTSLGKKEKYDKIKALGKPMPTDTCQMSAWWGQDAARLAEAHVYPSIDLCVARLDSFDVSSVAAFPTIKDPSSDVEPGVSLCKLGFPFHTIQPVWDDAAKAFRFPQGSLPLPLFPIEGMLTRALHIETPAGDEPFPFKMLETSSPGLKGQSGGPIFDQTGTVWAVQSATRSLALGFDPVVPNGGGRREHQFLNVGVGVHPESICGALDLHGVSYVKSAY